MVDELRGRCHRRLHGFSNVGSVEQREYGGHRKLITGAESVKATRCQLRKVQQRNMCATWWVGGLGKDRPAASDGDCDAPCIPVRAK